MTLEGKVAVVTGASRGIGRAIAEVLAQRGADVVCGDKLEEQAHATAAAIAAATGRRTSGCRVDVADSKSAQEFMDCALANFGRVDILVNNAWSQTDYSRLEHKTDTDMEGALRVALFAAFWAMQAVFPHMRRNGGGRIISICSLNGVNAHMYTAAYNVTKEALRTLTRTAAREWARHNILANVICPAAITPAYEVFRSASPENAAALLKQNPIGRMGDPERDIGGVALFLASEDSCYVTGNTIHADGGGHINGVSWAPELPE